MDPRVAFRILLFPLHWDIRCPTSLTVTPILCGKLTASVSQALGVITSTLISRWLKTACHRLNLAWYKTAVSPHTARSGQNPRSLYGRQFWQWPTRMTVTLWICCMWPVPDTTDQHLGETRNTLTAIAGWRRMPCCRAVVLNVVRNLWSTLRVYIDQPATRSTDSLERTLCHRHLLSSVATGAGCPRTREQSTTWYLLDRRYMCQPGDHRKPSLAECHPRRPCRQLDHAMIVSTPHRQQFNTAVSLHSYHLFFRAVATCRYYIVKLPSASEMTYIMSGG